MKKKITIFITLISTVLLFAIVTTTILAGLSDSFLITDTASQITVLGCNATYRIMIENPGNETDTYNLTITNIDNASVVVLDQSGITLDAGCTGNVTLNVTDDDIIGPYCVIVNATSQTNAVVTDEIEIVTAVIED